MHVISTPPAQLAPFFFAENPFVDHTLEITSPMDGCPVLRKLFFSEYDADDKGAFYHLSPQETIVVPCTRKHLPVISHPLIRAEYSRQDDDKYPVLIRITNLSRNSRVKIYSEQVLNG